MTALSVLNLQLLLCVTTIPFSTRSLATYLSVGGSDARLAAVTYGLIIEGVALSFTAICAWAWRARLLRPDVTGVDADVKLAGSHWDPLSSLAVAVALASALASLAIHGALAIFYAVSVPQGRLPSE